MGESIPEQQAIAETIALLEYYGFELNGQTAAATIEQWCAHSPVAWVRLAVLEALYRGRYKKFRSRQSSGFGNAGKSPKSSSIENLKA